MAKIGIEATKAQLEKAVEVTDGTTISGDSAVALKGTASGDDSVAIRGTASGEKSTAINANASGDYSVSIGGATTNDNSVGIGLGAEATGEQSVAIGLGAEAKQTNAVQIGEGENNTAQTLQFRNYQLLDVNGKIPDGRMQSTIDGTTKTVTQWLTEALQAKPIQSIGLDGFKIRIDYTDGTYIRSPDLKATYNSIGLVKLSDQFDLNGDRLINASPLNYVDPETRRVDSARVPMNLLDKLVVMCLFNNGFFNEENPLYDEEKEAISNLLGLALDNVTIGQTTQTVAQWLSVLNSEVNEIGEVITDIEGVVG